jgi:hypothetical protein
MRDSRIPGPSAWELREIARRFVLLPFVLTPDWLGRAAARALVAYTLRPGGWAARSRSRRFPPALAARTGIDKQTLITRNDTNAAYEQVLLLRGIVFPWWKRRLRVTGLGHLRHSLGAGNGVILWVHPCAASNVAVKQALFMAGHPLVHLSRPSHPFSARPFGRRFVNPILRMPEVRFLAERVVIENDQTIAPLRRLRKVLKEHRVISITVTAGASRLNEFELLGGTLRLPAGPVELAAATGARLLPVFTWSSDSRTHVRIGAPLPVSGGDATSVREAQRAAVQWLEARILEHPDSWAGWRNSQFRVDSPA